MFVLDLQQDIEQRNIMNYQVTQEVKTEAVEITMQTDTRMV
jgi:hypothetical protein